MCFARVVMVKIFRIDIHNSLFMTMRNQTVRKQRRPRCPPAAAPSKPPTNNSPAAGGGRAGKGPSLQDSYDFRRPESVRRTCPPSASARRPQGGNRLNRSRRAAAVCRPSCNGAALAGSTPPAICTKPGGGRRTTWRAPRVPRGARTDPKLRK